MKPSSKIVFFGNERLSSGFSPHGAPTLQALIDNGYSVLTVVASHQEATSRKARKLEIQEVADKYDIPMLLPEKPTAVRDQLVAMQPDIGVLVAYGRIVPQSIIDIFPRGIINIHPSLLPQYRGSTPIEQAILDGAAKTGVSLMQLVKAMDAGPIFAQAEVTLNGTETKAELTERLLTLGGQMLIEKLPAIIDGSLQPTSQDETKATYSRQLSKADGVVDLSKPADQLEREVRAYLTWPKSRFTLFSQDVIITKCRVAHDENDGSLVVPAGNKTFLEVQELVAPSGRTMNGADFLRGYKK
jgi:methionyl-tRNA formyltransferase